MPASTLISKKHNSGTSFPKMTCILNKIMLILITKVTTHGPSGKVIYPGCCFSKYNHVGMLIAQWWNTYTIDPHAAMSMGLLIGFTAFCSSL